MRQTDTDQHAHIAENVRIDRDQDMLLCSVGQYRQFLAQGALGIEALGLYLHLQFTARVQATNQVWAKDSYLRKGLQIGQAKLKRLKAILHNMGLIEYVQQRGADGRLAERYIRVRLWASERATGSAEIDPPAAPVVQKTDPPVSRTTGDRNQMLKSSKENAGVSKPKCERDPPHPAGEELVKDRYRELCEQYGARVVVDYIQRVRDWDSANGGHTRDPVATAAVWLARDRQDGKIRRTTPEDPRHDFSHLRSAYAKPDATSSA